MTVPSDLLISIMLAGIVAAVLIVCTHILLATRLSRLVAYVVGVAEIGMVITAWGLMTGHTDTILAYWGVYGIAGAADLVAWWVRGQFATAADAAEGNGYARGQIAGPEHPREAPDA